MQFQFNGVLYSITNNELVIAAVILVVLVLVVVGAFLERRKVKTEALRKRFGGIEDWSGFEEAQSYGWHRQLHLFECPFYYIEYGIAQLGALQVWHNANQNRAEGIKAYKSGLSKGSTLDLPGLFREAGIQFDFSEKTLRPLMAEVDEALRKLRD